MRRPGMDMPVRISIGRVPLRKGEFSVTMPPDDAGHCVPWGLVVLAGDLRIVYANARAKAMLAEGDGLCMNDGRLSAERSTTLRRLEACALGFMGMHPQPRCSVLGIPGREGNQRYALRLVPCELPEVFGKDCFVAVISDLSDANVADRATIASVFTLSEREAQFAVLFASGLRVATIAQRMGVALNTARVHLRHVLAKTGATSQIELARMFARLP